MSHHSKYALSSTLLIYNALIAIAFRDYNADFQCHSDCWFFFILWLTCWYANMKLSDHMSHCSKYALYSTQLIYSALIAIVFRDYNAVFQCHCWFLFILWWACWYWIWAHLARRQCRVSVTQVTVKACKCFDICDFDFFNFLLTQQMFKKHVGDNSDKQIRIMDHSSISSDKICNSKGRI